jgi:hypothetical protein
MKFNEKIDEKRIDAVENKQMLKPEEVIKKVTSKAIYPETVEETKVVSK